MMPMFTKLRWFPVLGLAAALAMIGPRIGGSGSAVAVERPAHATTALAHAGQAGHGKVHVKLPSADGLKICPVSMSRVDRTCQPGAV